MKTCPKCKPKTLYTTTDMHCPICGTVLEHTHLDKCKKCDDIIVPVPGGKYCRHCGADLSVG